MAENQTEESRESRLKPYRNKIIGGAISTLVLVLVVYKILDDLQIVDVNGYINQQPLVLRIVLVIGFLIVFLLGIYVVPSLLAEDAEEKLSKDKRRSVLFLRSFERDTLGINFNDQIDNAELILTSVFSTLGPFVAIGKPGENLQSVGASRMYVSHDLWQEKVIELMNESQIIILEIDTSEGLMWEINQLLEFQGDATKLLFVPLGDPRQSKHRILRRMAIWRVMTNRLSRIAKQWEYSRIRRKLKSVFPNMPKKIGDAVFLDVTNRGECRALCWRPSGFIGYVTRISLFKKVAIEHIRFAESARRAVPHLKHVSFHGMFNIPTRLYYWLLSAQAYFFALFLAFAALVIIAAGFSELVFGLTLDEVMGRRQ